MGESNKTKIVGVIHEFVGVISPLDHPVFVETNKAKLVGILATPAIGDSSVIFFDPSKSTPPELGVSKYSIIETKNGQNFIGYIVAACEGKNRFDIVDHTENTQIQNVEIASVTPVDSVQFAA